mgnify:CR=1 FL=1
MPGLIILVLLFALPFLGVKAAEIIVPDSALALVIGGLAGFAFFLGACYMDYRSYMNDS